MDPEQDLYSFYDEPIEPIGVFANESDDEEAFAQAAFGQPGPAFGQPGPAFGQPGPAFTEADLFGSISPAVKRIETSRMAQANRDAASDEQCAVATQLRAAPLPSPHTSHKSKGSASCMECANTLNKLYIQNGSTIDFAMIDYRWPSNICRHLKPEARCILCYGVSMCKHNRDKFRCVKCMGAAYCRDPTHRNRGKNGAALRKTACKDCIAEKSLIGSVFVSEKGNGAEAQGGTKRLIKRKHSTKRRRSVKKKRFTKRNNK
jgi:hypothetical protein